jgi:hypothetical protein
MEREEAAKTGLRTKNIDEYNFPELLKKSGGDFFNATVERYSLMLSEAGVASGRVAITVRWMQAWPFYSSMP